jgi:hypothetical protein
MSNCCCDARPRFAARAGHLLSLNGLKSANIRGESVNLNYFGDQYVKTISFKSETEAKEFFAELISRAYS